MAEHDESEDLQAENAALRAEVFRLRTLRMADANSADNAVEAFVKAADGRDALRAELAQTRKRAEQLEVQLAGCATAAQGHTQNPAVRGDYGWSPAYQDVLELRLRWTAALDRLKALEEWKQSILGLLQTYPEFEQWEWGGDKTGWGFCFEFIKRMVGRVKALEKVAARMARIIVREITTLPLPADNPDATWEDALAREAIAAINLLGGAEAVNRLASGSTSDKEGA